MAMRFVFLVFHYFAPSEYLFTFALIVNFITFAPVVSSLITPVCSLIAVNGALVGLFICTMPKIEQIGRQTKMGVSLLELNQN